MKSWVVCQMIGLVAGLLGLALGHDHALRTADSVAGRVWQNSMPNRKGGDGSCPPFLGITQLLKLATSSASRNFGVGWGQTALQSNRDRFRMHNRGN